MIVYDLTCDQGHVFEGWFKQSQDYSEQQTAGLLACPLCGSQDITKSPNACHVHTRGARDETAAAQAMEQRQLLKTLQHHLDRYFIDVGKTFPEEARKIHYGETQARNIRGSSTHDELLALREEGIEVVPLPSFVADKEKLN